MGVMTSIALVLGAGGVVGGAYHVGAVAALADATGWDARRADLIVGTSAGSGIAATLRVGFSPADHLARALDQKLSAEGEALGALIPRERVQLPDRPGFDPFALLHPTAPWLALPAFLAPGPVRPGLLAGMLPRGTVDTAPLGDRIRTLTDTRWPDAPTWICAVRVRDGKRVVFGRDDVDVPDLGRAVEASSAIPSYFRPVRIGNHEYLDGGLFSTTNTELVAPLRFDLVVVVAPMAAVPDAITRSVWGSLRAMAARGLAREVARVRDAGTPVLVVQPTADDLEVMGTDYLANDAASPVALRAYDTVSRFLHDDRVTDRVALLRQAAARTTQAP